MILNLNNEQQRQKFDQYSKKLLEVKCKVEIKKIQDTRTARQNRALHVFYGLICTELNELGMEFQYFGVSGQQLSTRYTTTIVKERFWRPIQEALFQIKSTKDINSKQINEIVDVITKFFAEKGVNMEFPSIESMMNKE